MEAYGERGVRHAVVLTAGFREVGAEGAALEESLLTVAHKYGIRFIGPNCLGIQRPSLGLNATFALDNGLPGDLALVSQSGALCTAMLDWAASNSIGFSSVISTGASADLDFGEILDYLAFDTATRGILMYIEGIRDARRFMSAVRAVARLKPVVLIKVGRHAAGLRAVQSHTGALVGSDAVFDALVRRAGVVRVDTILKLFASAKALASRLHPAGNRLAIVTNGGGPGVMATDRAVDLGVQLAEAGATDAGAPQRGPAIELVTRQSRGHHRRCRRRPLSGLGRGLPGGPRRGWRAGDAHPAGHDQAHRGSPGSGGGGENLGQTGAGLLDR